MWWVIVAALLALLVMIILAVIFYGGSEKANTGLFNCESKGGGCISEGTDKGKAECGEGNIVSIFTCPEKKICCFKEKK